MLSLLTWMLVVYGISDTVAKSRVAAPLRQRIPLRGQLSVGHLVRCPKCVGFWVGAGLTLLRLGPFSESGSIPISMLLNGFAASAGVWVVYVVLVRLGAEEL